MGVYYIHHGLSWLTLAEGALADERGLFLVKSGIGWVIGTLLVFAASDNGFTEVRDLMGTGIALVAPDSAAAALRPSRPSLAVQGYATTGGVGSMEQVAITQACGELAFLAAFS